MNIIQRMKMMKNKVKIQFIDISINLQNWKFIDKGYFFNERAVYEKDMN